MATDGKRETDTRAQGFSVEDIRRLNAAIDLLQGEVVSLLKLMDQHNFSGKLSIDGGSKLLAEVLFKDELNALGKLRTALTLAKAKAQDLPTEKARKGAPK